MANYDAYISPERSIENAERLSVPLVRSNKFEAPAKLADGSERVYRQPGYYQVFCVHNRAFWEPCSASTCRRTRAEANANAARMLGVSTVL